MYQWRVRIDPLEYERPDQRVRDIVNDRTDLGVTEIPMRLRSGAKKRIANSHQDLPIFA
jgi:hypothetical protein